MFAALCDDDKYITKEIKKLLLEYAKDNRITIDIDEFESGEELLNSEKNYDIIVLDYQLGSTNGLTVAKELRKRNVLSSIIFLTSYPNFMIDAFEVNTFRFLLKPIDKSKFFKAIDDYIKIVDANYPITIIQNKELKKIWLDKFSVVPANLKKMQEVNSVATAFNTNVDAVLKVKGSKIAELAGKLNMSLNDLNDIQRTKLDEPSDVLKGLFRCFKRGIAEEWLTEDKLVYDWMVDNLGYDRLQMGGQGGIVANALAVTGVKKVYAHTNSLPELQANQFLKLDNLLSFDAAGEETPAHKINRETDIPLIHWILEFDKGDKVELDGETFVCPKSNRFIATYDPLNLHLVMDEHFVRKMSGEKVDYVVLSGFHALTERNNGVKLQDDALPIIQSWKDQGDLIHLEIASTQDIAVRKAIIKKIAPIVDSVGINEREAIDILEVTGFEDLAEKFNNDTHSVYMFEAILNIKKHIKTPRIQLHMFGLYLTLQDKNYKITPEENLRGMMLAATVAAGKAGTGTINVKENLLWAQGQEVSDVGLNELKDLAEHLKDDKLAETGFGEGDGYDLFAVPTILVEKPVTLVGMGDTISSISLVGAR